MSLAGIFDLRAAARSRAQALTALVPTRRGDLLDLLDRIEGAGPAEAFDEAHRRLLLGLQAQGATIPHAIRPLERPPGWLAQFDDGFEGVLGEGCLRGVRSRAGDEISLAGVVGGAAVDAVAAWMLAASVVTSAKARPERPIVIVLDAGAGTAAAMDGSAPLSEYLAHLARAIGWVRSQAVTINLWLVGPTDPVVLLACAAGASRVVAFPGASLIEAGGAGTASASGVSAGPPWIAAGIADELAQTGRRIEIAWNTA